jgi:hypothetical protein
MNKMLETFLARQYEEGMALARASDLIDLRPIGPHPPSHYVVVFHCNGLMRAVDGKIVPMRESAAGIWFPDHYLTAADPYRILVWLDPPSVWHPNISDRAPIVCLGRLGPGTRLVDLLFQLYEIVSWQRLSMDEHDALNPAAAAWARENQDRFPVDRRPLKRRRSAPAAVARGAAPATPGDGR